MHRVDGPGHNNNQFTEGDPQIPTPATTVTADILNALQEEIANVVEYGGDSLDKLDNTQLLAKIHALILAGQPPAVPAGFILPYGSSVFPSGYLECNGAAVSRSTYADLFTAISTTWGVGDGSTTFNLPDFCGKFLRGWDHGAGNDPDAAARTGGDVVGSTQADEFKSHLHTVPTSVFTGNTGATNISNFTAPDSTGNTNQSGGSETRPINAAALFCIKY